MTKTNFRLQKKGDKSAELVIYDVIGAGFFGGISAKEVVDQLKAMGDVEEINVRINSPGGSGFDGIAIFNALERHKAAVAVDVDAVAASAAALVAMAATPGKLRIASNARMMIHNASAYIDGDKNDLNRMIERLRTLDDIQAATFAKRAKVSKQELLSMMDAETWFTADEAVKIGLADEVTGALNIAAMAGEIYSKFKNVPADLAAQLKTGEPEMTDQEIQAKVNAAVTSAVEPLKAEHTKAIERLTADHSAQLAAAKNQPPKNDGKQEPTVEEVRASERTRTKDLTNLFASAGLKESAVLDRWIDKGVSLVEAKAEIGDLAIKQNKLVGDDSNGGENSNDPKVKYREEYRKDMKIYASMGITNVDDYIHSRMVDDGLAMLIPGQKTGKPAA